jgi:ABC-type multidrug transport system permease subunit
MAIARWASRPGSLEARALDLAAAARPPRKPSALLNVLRIAYLELLWGMRITENVLYNFFYPILIFVVLSLIQPDASYLQMLVPGVLALSTASSSMQGIGKTVSFMRIYGTWRTLQASPIQPEVYLAGLLTSRFARILLSVTTLLVLATVGFGYRHEGHVALTYLLVLLGSAVFGALGLFISYLVRAPQAVAALLNFVLLPMIFISRVFFQVKSPWIEKTASFLPLQPLVVLLRNSADGEPWTSQSWMRVALLLGWLAVLGWSALWMAKRRVEE